MWRLNSSTARISAPTVEAFLQVIERDLGDQEYPFGVIRWKGASSEVGDADTEKEMMLERRLSR